MNGLEFGIVTDHKTLLSAINPSHSFMHSRLTRWVNRLLPFNFKIRLMPGKEIGFRDLMSRLPSGKALPTSHYDKKLGNAPLNKVSENLFIIINCKKRN